jgi:hypothetical protein
MVCEGVDCIQLAQDWNLDFHMLIINTIVLYLVTFDQECTQDYCLPWWRQVW